MGKPCSCMQLIKAIFVATTHTKFVVLLQVTHAESEYARNRSTLYQKNTHLLPLAFVHVLCTRSNTDCNKLVIFSSTALNYGDSYITKYLY